MDPVNSNSTQGVPKNGPGAPTPPAAPTSEVPADAADAPKTTDITHVAMSTLTSPTSTTSATGSAGPSSATPVAVLRKTPQPVPSSATPAGSVSLTDKQAQQSASPILASQQAASKNIKIKNYPIGVTRPSLEKSLAATKYEKPMAHITRTKIASQRRPRQMKFQAPSNILPAELQEESDDQ